MANRDTGVRCQRRWESDQNGGSESGERTLDLLQKRVCVCVRLQIRGDGVQSSGSGLFLPQFKQKHILCKTLAAQCSVKRLVSPATCRDLEAKDSCFGDVRPD